jgi:hypothetical protein
MPFHFYVGKAVKVLLESCINLGGTLLKQWTPEGDKRDSKNEREFKKDMEDFYETAKCTRFDDDIQVIRGICYSLRN